MNPYLESFPALLTIRGMPDGPERRHFQRAADLNASTALTHEAREATPGTELYRLRHARHPLLRQFARLLTIALAASIGYGLLARASMTQVQLHRGYWINGALLALLSASLVVILIGQHRRQKWLKSQYEAATAKLDGTSADTLEMLRHLYTFRNERPGASCGCLGCMKLFAVPKDSSLDAQEVKCPSCGSFNIVYDSAEAPLTPESLAGLHDFIYKE
ncbi:MAG: hypothetical protein IJJ45_04490 [Clostridia bacterium]|nr:hypothetical protein [Clostridia bacterium]